MLGSAPTPGNTYPRPGDTSISWKHFFHQCHLPDQPESCPRTHWPWSKASHRTNTSAKQTRQESLKRTKHLDMMKFWCHVDDQRPVPSDQMGHHLHGGKAPQQVALEEQHLAPAPQWTLKAKLLDYDSVQASMTKHDYIHLCHSYSCIEKPLHELPVLTRVACGAGEVCSYPGVNL